MHIINGGVKTTIKSIPGIEIKNTQSETERGKTKENYALENYPCNTWIQAYTDELSKKENL